MKVIAEIAGALLLRALFVARSRYCSGGFGNQRKKLRPREEVSAVEFFLSPRMRILIGTVLGLLIAFTVLILVEIVSKGERDARNVHPHSGRR